MKWILLAIFCMYLTYVFCEEAADAVPSDSVVSLLLPNSNDNHPTNIRNKRHEDTIEVESRGRWRKKHRNHGGHGQQQNYPSGFGGGPVGSGSQSSANSQSSAWGQGGGSGSQSSSNAQSGSFGHGGGSGSGSGSSASANSGSWGNGGGGSLTQSDASSSAHGQGGLGGSLSGANSQSSATGQGGFFYPGSYNK